MKLASILCAALLATLLLACPPPPAAACQGTACADAGDSGDPGDWSHAHPVAACGSGLAAAPCGDLAGFRLSGCEVGSLGQLQRAGAFNVHLLYEDEARSDGVTELFLSADGGTDWLSGRPADRKQLTDTSFYLSNTRKLGDGGTQVRSYVGCNAPSPTELRGCYVGCLNGRKSVGATFVARKHVRKEGEAESQGLELLSETPWEGDVEPGAALPVDVFVTQGHAYVVGLHGGLNVYDLAERGRPRRVKTIHDPLDDYWNGVWAKDGALYVASADTGIVTFDLANPADPVKLSTLPVMPIDVHTVHVTGNLLLGTSPEPNGEVLVVDVSQPKAPTLVSRFLALGTDPSVGYWPHDASIFEDRLYVNHWALGLVIADLSTPAFPTQLGNYRYAHSTSHANVVARYGDRLIAFEGGEDWGAQLRVLDVTDPQQIRLLARYRVRDFTSIHNFVLSGTRLYVAYYQEGVRVLDVATPEEPREIAYFNTYRDSDPFRGVSFYEGAIGIRVPGDGYVYVVDTSRGLMIFREPK